MDYRSLLLMPSEKYAAYHPRTEQEVAEYEKASEIRTDYLEWCTEFGEDPELSESLEHYEEIQAEQGQAWWDGLDENDRERYEHNMNKDD